MNWEEGICNGCGLICGNYVCEKCWDNQVVFFTPEDIEYPFAVYTEYEFYRYYYGGRKTRFISIKQFIKTGFPPKILFKGTERQCDEFVESDWAKQQIVQRYDKVHIKHAKEMLEKGHFTEQQYDYYLSLNPKRK